MGTEISGTKLALTKLFANGVVVSEVVSAVRKNPFGL